jgi:hypothetical protein
LLVAGDPGIPKTLAPISYGNLAPRIGLAYSPRFDQGLGRAIFGGSGQSSIRASYGLFYTAFPGLLAGIMYSVPPFGFNYLSPGPPLLETPFITAATGVNNGQRFPFPFPPHNVSASHPDTSVNWANFVPLAADPFFYYRNRVPYINNYMLSIQRQVTRDTLLTVSYVGNQGHHILALVSANPGNPALCLSLARCGPFGEDNHYTNSRGKQCRGPASATGTGLRGKYGRQCIYCQLELQRTRNHAPLPAHGSQFLLSYTYAKSIDQGSNLGEQLNPINPRQSRAISAWDQKQTFVGSYTLALPLASLFHRSNRLTEEWSLSGTTRFRYRLSRNAVRQLRQFAAGHAGQRHQQLPARHPAIPARATQNQHERPQRQAQPSTPPCFR